MNKTLTEYMAIEKMHIDSFTDRMASNIPERLLYITFSLCCVSLMTCYSVNVRNSKRHRCFMSKFVLRFIQTHSI